MATKKVIKSVEKKEVTKEQELRAQAKVLRAEIMQMRIDNTQGKLKNTSSLSHKKHALARVLTAARQVKEVK